MIEHDATGASVSPVVQGNPSSHRFRKASQQKAAADRARRPVGDEQVPPTLKLPSCRLSSPRRSQRCPSLLCVNRVMATFASAAPSLSRQPTVHSGQLPPRHLLSLLTTERRTAKPLLAFGAWKKENQKKQLYRKILQSCTTCTDTYRMVLPSFGV